MKTMGLGFRERLTRRRDAFITQRPDLVRIIQSVAWLSLDRGRLLLNIALGVWMARQFKPELFGVLNYALAVVGIIGIGADLGVESIVIRELVKSPERRDELLGTAFWLRLAAATVCYSGIVFYIFFFAQADARLLIAVAGLMVFAQPALIVRGWFHAELHARATVVVYNYVWLFATAVRIVLLATHRPLIEFAALAVLEQCLTAVLLLIAYQRHTQRFDWRCFHTQTAVELLKLSWPLILAAASVAIYMKIDQVMLQRMLGSEATGMYTAAVKISEIWYFLPAILATSVFPSIVRSREGDRELYRNRLQQYFSLNALLALTISIPVSLCAGRLIGVLYGNDYAEAGPILAVHIWASVFVFLGVAREQFLLAEGLLRFSLAATLTGAVANVCLNFVLIPTHRGFGAAVATAISYGIAAMASSFFHERVRSAGWMQLRALFLPGSGLKMMFRSQQCEQ